MNNELNNSVNVHSTFPQRLSTLSSHYYFLFHIPEKSEGNGMIRPHFTLKLSFSPQGLLVGMK